MRDVVRQALEEVAEQGLPGDHHLYVHFRTSHPGVSIPGFLRQRFPEEMGIVFQHQFWGLMVDEEAFSVTLAFDGARYSVMVPFEAVTAFADPSVNFLLSLEAEGLAAATGDEEPAAISPAGETGKGTGTGKEKDDEPPTPDGGGGGRVVDFQRFRKR